ncbi:unnamed protein product [Rotaria socialis]|uniref:ubiquitinyl hydrolase 1 n=1 Tax=Rotaria socialis TaxID=392032 RepID=A0A818BD82_9BILA|nr:unnamed protein product [Rotaria socialis]CAF3415069.1 unnamed protein product [Rotaria socialis]CAF4420011.1 unnamed protein product [Rotaria socialis]CAF4696086.1 unnamed protein product [Rotaria socialis]
MSTLKKLQTTGNAINQIKADYTPSRRSLTEFSPPDRNFCRSHTNVCGLRNLGRTCYINSALQCITNIKPLTSLLITSRQNNQMLTPVSIAYTDLILEMLYMNVTSASPVALKEKISELCSRFASFHQQDSYEFLNILIDVLCQDLCPNSAHVDSSADSAIVHGNIKSLIKCLECKKDLSSYEFFTSLPLPIPTSSSVRYKKENGMLTWLRYIFPALTHHVDVSLTMKECFDLLTKPETLSEYGQWYCNECGRLTNAEKKLNLWTLPKILILQLKRFTYDLSNNNKINTFVDYPLENLDLSDYVINPDYDRTTRYNLVAVSVHSGSLSGGHYTAFAQNFDTKRWYHFNDENVRDVSSKNEIITADACILVYIQQALLSSEVD